MNFEVVESPTRSPGNPVGALARLLRAHHERLRASVQGKLKLALLRSVWEPTSLRSDSGLFVGSFRMTHRVCA